ncbi:hypothetical protein EJ02DRAFT_434406 [Clathrospora elynae]|uniref:Uncharacterized protein n=1 Tax=Clathrospora elynae TaxID=706981 RepID=A0A6A5SY12_9PLEO|nr:hypothetical protein EJ02DRAFT_434406 [Clathrospora elynae]
MAGSNRRTSNSNSHTNNLHFAHPTTHNNDTGHIKSRLDGDVTATEIAQEAYCVCHINGFLRKDLKQTKDELRKASDGMKDAVQEDALHEMRQELPETCRLPERAWELLKAHQRLKIPENMKMAYDALKKRDPHDWQPKKGMKYDARLSKKGKKGAGTAKTEQKNNKRKAKEKETKQTAFLLHTPDGNTYDLRKPTVAADEAVVEEENKVDDTEAGDDVELFDLSKHNDSYRPLPRGGIPNGSSRTVGNVAASAKRKATDTTPFAALKTLKANDENVRHSTNTRSIFARVVEGAFHANNIFVGVKRKMDDANTLVSVTVKKMKLV